jgi:ubiquinone/menaquinone biosynthesis C-methylase UbiE
MSIDNSTAEAFANSWNNLPNGSVYTFDQFEDWFTPLAKEQIQGKTVLELGCGNGSLLVHMTKWNPSKLIGVDLGDSVKSCNENMAMTGFKNYEIVKNDLVEFRSDEKFDLTYCIGVIHHVKEAFKAFESVVVNTKPGGNFHCWVYAKEGNAVIRYIVDPIRIIASKLPWWFNKYLIATPLSFLYFLYAHFIVTCRLSFAPLYLYSQWICKRNFLFFRHVAFDQLVTPQTIYIDKNTIDIWMAKFNQIDPDSCYTIFRNGNSWKFGGKIKAN